MIWLFPASRFTIDVEEEAMPARAIWKGDLRSGSQELGVKLYSAVEEHDVHFHLLEKKSRHRVQQRMVDPESGEEVEHKDVQRGYEIEPGIFVILQEDELAKLEPEESRNIELLHFLPSSAVHHQWYERPYFLAPDGDTTAYFALAEALKKQDKVALAKWVMRKKQYFGALVSEGDYLVLITLRSAGEVLLPKELPAPQAREATARELKMAKQLIAMLEGPFDPSEFHDEYTERLQDFLKARAKGRKPKLERIRTRRAGKSLEDDLAKSLSTMKEKKDGDEKAAA